MHAPSFPGVREITDEEVAHYRENGWVKLEKLFAPWAVEGLLERAKGRMGERPKTVSRLDPNERIPDEYGWYSRWDGPSHADPWIHELSHSRALARVASRLMGGPVRFYFDHIFVKVPAKEHGTMTPWHQDLPHHPLDRQGALTIWVPLIDCPPEMGTMRFLNGSHRSGLYGRFLNRDDGVSLIDDHPDVLERFTQSPPLDLRAGDATVHNLAVIHYAPANITDEPRWVYANQWLPPSARYTGAPNHRTDGWGLELDKPLDHPRFPLIPTD
ncbi:MAG: phytanoyl-CoA dioxygenase [Lysobacteraceae bacterium]|nr:MAG: phytanoyl-CoA dioxygenase [Xanthomonadaceae bacterium]